MDIIALMITYGGSNATITHGAGINNKNLNDIVLKIEFVNALGELQVIFYSLFYYVVMNFILIKYCNLVTYILRDYFRSLMIPSN